MSRPCHNLWYNKKVFLEDGLELLSSLCDGLVHVVGNLVLEDLQLGEIEGVSLELFSL
jgi:hypothetical protein